MGLREILAIERAILEIGVEPVIEVQPIRASHSSGHSDWLRSDPIKTKGIIFLEHFVGEACFLLYQPCIWEKIKPGYARGNGVDKGPLVKESEPRNGEKLNSVMPFQTLHAAMSEIWVNLWMIVLHGTIKSPFPSVKVPIPELQSHHL